jgi:hypothetical protein
VNHRKPQAPVCNGVLGPRRYRATEADRLAQYEAAVNESIAHNWSWDRETDERPGSC